MKSLKFKLMVTFILLIVASFSVMAFILFHSSKTIISSYIEESALEKMQEYATYVEMLQNQVYDSASLVYNSDVIDIWDRAHTADNATDGSKMLANLELSEYLTQVTNSYTPLANMTIYRHPNLWISSENYISRSESFKGETWYVDLTKRERYWSPAGSDMVEMSRGNENAMVSMTMPLDTYKPELANSFLKINVSETYFLEPLERLHLGETGQIYLIDRHGQMLLPGQSQSMDEHQYAYFDELKTITSSEGRLFRTNTEGEKEMIVYKRLSKTKWMLVGIVSEKDLYSQLYNLRDTVIVIVSILLVVSIILTLVFSHSISRPLNSLVAAMRHLKRGDFVQAENRMANERSSTMEIAFVIEVFKSMISQLRQYISKEYQLTLLKQKADYKALVMQINPHFLFNTLEMISSLALQNRGKETSKMILTLGHMMRYSLKVSDDLVYLREELKYIHQYLDIIRVRYHDRSNIELTTHGPTDELLILKFMLQPIIENAVKFSSQHNDYIETAIDITRREHHLHIRISDNGPGFTADEKYQLMHRVMKQWQSQQYEDKDRHIGLHNVLLRSYAVYGDAFHYEIGVSRFGGAEVSLYVPIKEAEQYD
ncbi:MULTISPECIES: cache domain-containing sensor histidine kinase [Paenibacillus]|uniref:cache domain-containing sensor histidine kinase n=1 Tax=Paenibacillus TaxID=44249 RepID=UPI00203ABAB3|nr:sensor histidine kinase [Paenibacillus camelliae]MCM3634537.1 histidine kinase [Paenibacillus camelliae]